jgi:hypothetical protein
MVNLQITSPQKLSVGADEEVQAKVVEHLRLKETLLRDVESLASAYSIFILPEYRDRIVEAT